MVRDEQPQLAGGHHGAHQAKTAWIVYWVAFWTLVLVIYPILMLVPALGDRQLVLGVTLRASAGTAVYVLGGAVILRYFAIPLYSNAWRTLPPAWWRWAIVGGLLVAVASFTGAGTVVLLHTQMGDAVGFPLYVSGICLAFAGVGAFGVGSIAMALASRPRRREHDRLPGQ
jgi:hypothetical protein